MFRPSNGVWYILGSSTGFKAVQFGMDKDVIVPADYEGDAKTDLAVYRIGAGVSPHNEVNNVWYVLKSSNNTMDARQWGNSGVSMNDIPVPADFDGDQRTDFTILRQTDIGGEPGKYWVLQNPTDMPVLKRWGYSYDKPVLADYDGDGKDDLAVVRPVPHFSFSPGSPSASTWYILQSSNGEVKVERFGVWGDRHVPADYDGDGKADIAVYRPSNGFWYRINSSDGSFYAQQFGVAEDKPVPADYDGDSKTDIGVFRPSTGTWYLMRSQAGFIAQQFGSKDDIPVENAYIR